jgi:epsilon-lactone hydrolase
MILPTKWLHFSLKVFPVKKIATNRFLKPTRSKSLNIPNSLKKGFRIEQFLVKNRNVVTFIPREVPENKHLFFLHGGAYTAEVQSSHWGLIKDLVSKTFFKLSFIDYPLAPEHTYKESHEMVFQAYSRLVEKYPNDEFYFVGDSAGGGFCLSFAQTLRDIHFKKRPEKLVLLSPWVDISLSNPGIRELEKKDLLLNPKHLLSCSHYFAGGLDLKDPAVSPLYGDMDTLKHIGVFVGTHEILLPDCRELKRKIEKSNTDLFYKEYEDMQHDWMIFPIKERKILINDVIDYLLKKGLLARAFKG